jgi:hypothetical protein
MPSQYQGQPGSLHHADGAYHGGALQIQQQTMQYNNGANASSAPPASSMMMPQGQSFPFHPVPLPLP